MFLKVGLVILAIVVAFLGYVAIQPNYFFVSREVKIQASAEKIFPYLNTRKLANDWNPWFDLDPDAKITLSGPEVGVGSVTSWEGGKNLGTGNATVVESVPNQRVRITLTYFKPFEGKQDAEYNIRPSDNGSIVTWSVKGENTFIGRVICTFMSMDKMIGGTFQKGLLKLKTKVENS